PRRRVAAETDGQFGHASSQWSVLSSDTGRGAAGKVLLGLAHGMLERILELAAGLAVVGVDRRDQRNQLRKRSRNLVGEESLGGENSNPPARVPEQGTSIVGEPDPLSRVAQGGRDPERVVVAARDVQPFRL